MVYDLLKFNKFTALILSLSAFDSATHVMLLPKAAVKIVCL